MSEWSNMSTCKLLFQWVIKIQLSMLFWYKVFSSHWKVICPLHDVAEKLLTFCWTTINPPVSIQNIFGFKIWHGTIKWLFMYNVGFNKISEKNNFFHFPVSSHVKKTCLAEATILDFWLKKENNKLFREPYKEHSYQWTISLDMLFRICFFFKFKPTRA